MHFYAVKHDLHFAAIFNTLQRCFLNDSQNHLNNISEFSLKRRVNQNGCSTFVSSLKSIEYTLRLWQRFALAPYFGHFIERKTAL